MTDAKNLVAVSREDGARTIAIEVARAVAELPDRSSPDDWPDAMLVTAEELIEIVCTELRHHEVAASAPSGEGEEIAREAAFLCERLDEIDWGLTVEDVQNEFHGHVAPSIARLKMLIRGGKSG